ncbi:MAG: barstar family protein [Lachnospiraceae bacterium]|nr:barstar family protein [Lachnospiraceae bacterium]
MEYTIDALYLNDRETAHDYLAEIFDFPDYYGRNLDALYDCLSEMQIDRIYIKNADEGEYYFYSVLDVINDLDIEIENI